VQSIDLQQLTAGGNVTVVQQSGVFYYLTSGAEIPPPPRVDKEDTSALLTKLDNNPVSPQVTKEDILALLTKLHSKTIPLSLCLAEGFSLAVKLGNRQLVHFCRRELEGWKVERPEKVNLGDSYPKYRAVTAYVSPFRLKMTFPGWRGSLSNVIDFMEQDENFTRFSLFEPAPIADLEATVEVGAANPMIIDSTVRMGDVIQNASAPDLTLHQYFGFTEYEKVLRAVRNELNAHLLNLVEGGFPQTSLQSTSQEVKLKLMVFEEGRNRSLREEIHYTQPQDGYSNGLTFGLALVNETETVVPHGIYITVSFFWDGDGPELSPTFGFIPSHEGWAVEDDQITNEYPAVLKFEGSNVHIPYNHPKRWNLFLATLRERMRGRFRVEYTITSIQPMGQYTGNLYIVLD
jgi:hypothetical protein